MADASSLGRAFAVIVIMVFGFLAIYKNGYYLKKLLGDKNVEKPK